VNEPRFSWPKRRPAVSKSIARFARESRTLSFLPATERRLVVGSSPEMIVKLRDAIFYRPIPHACGAARTGSRRPATRSEMGGQPKKSARAHHARRYGTHESRQRLRNTASVKPDKLAHRRALLASQAYGFQPARRLRGGSWIVSAALRACFPARHGIGATKVREWNHRERDGTHPPGNFCRRQFSTSIFTGNLMPASRFVLCDKNGIAQGQAARIVGIPPGGAYQESVNQPKAMITA